MKIGIIGAGNIGATLTRRFRAVGHEVAVANSRGPETLRDLAAETGAKAVTVREAAQGRDVVVVTITEKNIPELPKDLFDGAPADLVVVDTGNYYPRQRDGRIEPIENGLTETEWVAQHLLENGKPKGAPGRIALPVAGDDPKAKSVVMQLVDDIGFDPVDAGALAESWRQQPGTPAYATDHDAAGLRRALAQASPERTDEFTGSSKSPGTFEAPA
jgi:predicted dinucleotide-binding enzyme